MTLERWSMGIVRPVMQVCPLARAVFVPFVVMATFAEVNLRAVLRAGLIVTSTQDAHVAEADAQTGSDGDAGLDRLRDIAARLGDRQVGSDPAAPPGA